MALHTFCWLLCAQKIVCIDTFWEDLLLHQLPLVTDSFAVFGCCSGSAVPCPGCVVESGKVAAGALVRGREERVGVRIREWQEDLRKRKGPREAAGQEIWVLLPQTC